MKYKVIGVVVCVIAILLSVIIPAYCIPSENDRYQQHISATLRSDDEVDDGTFNSHLPLIIITTDGTEIPGNPLIDPETGERVKDQYDHMVWSLADDGQPTIGAHIDVIDNEDVTNRPDDTPAISSDIRIRIRGNSSRLFDKKGYFIRLVTGEENNNQPLLGMDAHSEWALHGPFLDKTLIRNYMCYNIAGQIMDYAPNVRFCEVLLDGEYQGVYVLTEIITAGKDEGERLNIRVNKKHDTFSGYLLRLDRPDENAMKDANTFTQYTLRTKEELKIMYPGTKNLTEEMAREISKDFSAFEKALYSYDYSDSKYGYKEFIDVENFADYFILNEISCNYDAGTLSTFMYKGIDGKFRLCVWDFNNAFDNYPEQAEPKSGFQLQNGIWYNMLFRDEDFVKEVIDRYRFLRKNVLSTEYLMNYIEDVTYYLGPAIDRNFEKWGYSFEENLLRPIDRNPRSHYRARRQLEKFIEARLEWMDDNIESLLQYSKDSRNKKFNEGVK